ncbi:MAG: hypothetical protein K2N35_08995, partial [Muribaculaceae bacterium]|nr:hypothetical protein [Muribaculaceae bacterium]
LHELFEKITVSGDGSLIYNSRIDQRRVRADIRNCFATIRRFNTTEELVPESATLLKVGVLPDTKDVSRSEIYIPDQAKVNDIINSDDKPAETISDEVRKYLIEHNIPLPETEKSVNDRTYHYLPYHLDSTLEKDYFESIINHLKSKEMSGIEFYFNGDDTLTDFYIRCYTKRGRAWKLDGDYYPDFLMLTRNSDNTINKVIIIETKGEEFAGKFVPRKNSWRTLLLNSTMIKPGSLALTFSISKTRLQKRNVFRKQSIELTHSY